MGIDFSTTETHNQCKLLKTEKEEKTTKNCPTTKPPNILADVNQKVLL